MNNQNSSLHKPSWLKIKANFGPVYNEVKNLIKEHNLHTVCQEASCPNIGECFSARTATFIILGDRCTRNCRFCDVKPGRPLPPDFHEPERVAKAIQKLNLKYAVITSVTRDDLPDGGAQIFADTVVRIREYIPQCQIEVLVPDFKGNQKAMDIVIKSEPEVIAHNIETVPGLYSIVRPQADYERSLNVLKYFSLNAKNSIIKSGIMVGLGETLCQVEDILKDAVNAGCKIFTVGQYLSPSKKHLAVRKYYTPDEFEQIKIIGENLGISHVVSGPLVRSSYMAHNETEKFLQKNIENTYRIDF